MRLAPESWPSYSPSCGSTQFDSLDSNNRIKKSECFICRLGTRPLSRKCHARCGKAPQFSKQKRTRAEKVVCSDLLQPSDFPQLALALARFCKIALRKFHFTSA